MRGNGKIKVLCGLRGVGKSTALAAWRQELIAQGLPPERIISVNAEDPVHLRLATSSDVLRRLAGIVPTSGPVTLLIDEPQTVRDYVTILGSLLGQPRVDVVLAMSACGRSLHERVKHLHCGVAVRELLPVGGNTAVDKVRMRARWNEILLRDVLPMCGMGDVNVLERMMVHLLDSIGDSVALRTISEAISPFGKRLSPHTVSCYLQALEEAHVVERCHLWDSNGEMPLPHNYRVFITDLAMCGACFSGMPDSGWRTKMDAQWLKLRTENKNVYLEKAADGDHGLRFIVP